MDACRDRCPDCSEPCSALHKRTAATILHKDLNRHSWKTVRTPRETNVDRSGIDDDSWAEQEAAERRPSAPLEFSDGRACPRCDAHGADPCRGSPEAGSKPLGYRHAARDPPREQRRLAIEAGGDAK